MLTLRELSQWITFFVSTAVVMISIVAWVRYRVCSFGIFFLYGMADVAFYTIVLLFHFSSVGSAFSPMRSVFQDSVILTYLLLIIHDYTKTRGTLWKPG